MNGVDHRPRGTPARVAHVLGEITAGIGVVAVALLMLHVVADVTGRYLFNSPVAGTLEAVAFWWMPSVSFLGLAVTQRVGQHIEVHVLADRLPPRVAAALAVVTSCLTMVVVAAIGWYGLAMALDKTAIREAALGAVLVPIWPARFLVPLGCAVFLCQLLIDTAGHLTRLSRGGGDDDRHA